MPKQRVRPDPVSCQSCRAKKLKCNRVQPCSNCTSRHLDCHFLVPPQPYPMRISHVTATRQHTCTLQTCVERIETASLANKPTPTSTPAPRLLLANPKKAASESILHENRDRESRLLESIGARDVPDSSPSSVPLVFRTKGIHEILPLSANDGLVVVLPNHHDATLLFQNYEYHVDHLVRILHIPTMRAALSPFYLCILQHEPVAPGQAALLLSIFSIAAYFYEPHEKSEIASSKEDIVKLSRFLAGGAIDVLEYSRKHLAPTLEDAQAYILMSFVTYHLDGFCARGRMLSAMAAAIARELRLHQVDADESQLNQGDSRSRSTIDREVKRRVFWHITATDWLSSAVSGPQEGTYFIHPKHINVNFPRDCPDNDILAGDTPITSSSLTGMTFFLERLKLAHICREMADVVPLETPKLTALPYDEIITLDTKIKDFTYDLPYIFKLDHASRQRTHPLEAIYRSIPIARYCIHSNVHSRRCKLHQKFLMRQSLDPRYAYSREACLESARATIHAFQDLREHGTLMTVPEVTGMAVRFTHLALVIMIMDLCFNKNEADEVVIKAEVRSTLHMFEHRSTSFPLLARLAESLKEVLKKHDVHLLEPVTVHGSHDQVTPDDGVEDAIVNEEWQQGPNQLYQLGIDMQDTGFTFDASFQTFWDDNMLVDQVGDSLAWDKLFSSLDSRPI